MRKGIIALALVLAVGLGFVTTNALAGYGMGRGMMGYNNPQASSVNTQAYQDFMKSTEKIRSDISADRAERAAIMAGQNPDATKVRALTEKISANMNALQEKAAAMNLPATCVYGSGMGSGMGRGMMGYGNGCGFGCPRR